MCDELARRVRLQAREPDEALAADAHHGVLHAGRLLAALLEQLADEPLVALGFGEMTRNRLGELGVANDLGRPLQLRERLHFDRMCIGEVTIQLFLQPVQHRSQVLPSPEPVTHSQREHGFSGQLDGRGELQGERTAPQDLAAVFVDRDEGEEPCRVGKQRCIELRPAG